MSKTNCPIPCILCGSTLVAVGDFKSGNQPYEGLEFIGYGHYGCTVWDPMNSWYGETGPKLIVNICDKCLLTAQSHGRVAVWTKADQLEIWDSRRDYERE